MSQVWPLSRSWLPATTMVVGFVVAGVAAAQSSTTSGATDNGNPEADVSTPGPVPVRFRARVLFEINAPIGELSPAQRAQAIEERLLALADRPDSVLADLRVVERDARSELYGGELLIRTITDRDAQGTGRTRRQLAADQLLMVRAALADEFRGRSTTALIRASILAIVATGLFVLIGLGLLRVHRWIRGRILRAAQNWHWQSGLARLRLLSPANVSSLSRAIAATLAWVAALLLVYLYLEFVLSLFPWTRGIADSMVAAAKNAVFRVLSGLLAYLPKLLNILVIVIVARIALKAMRSFFEQVGDKKIDISGFYPEWAQPTYSLLRTLVIAVAAIMVFPYLPGSGSEGFKGVTVFIGLLVSLGAASAIANVIAGIVLTYMRPFRVGDRVKIADAVGDVTGKDLFVVRLRTVKNVDITVPNALVLANHIVNFSSSAASMGLILHTTVTIGYDVPWQKVQELLIAAAKRTEGVSADPAPFVLQTSLDDFYVSYELNSYTDRPQEMAAIYSRLHAAIQDEFNTAGVEIMSPHYSAVRDGGRMAVPDDYLPKNYQAPGLGILLHGRPKLAGDT